MQPEPQPLGRLPRRSQRSLARWFLIPGLLFVLYLALPIARLLGVAPRAIANVLGEAEVESALWLTFGCSALATMIGVLFSIPLGYALTREPFRGRRLLMGLVDMPLVVPHPVSGIALLLLFSRRAWMGRVLALARVHLVGTVGGIVAVMLLVASPYLVHACRDGFREVDVRYEQLARTLGCGRWSAFWRVSLPLARRHVVSGAILLFARAVSEFGALLIIAYNPRAISILIYERFTTYGLSAALPVAALLVIFGFGVVLAISGLEGVQP
jgi:molybdate/tungstate transport system permease protein